MFGGNGNWQVADPRVIVHNEDTYLANRAEIERLQAALNKAAAINEQGKRNFEQLENELKRKAQEGEDAQRKLDALRHSRNLLTYPDSNPPAATANVLALLNYSPVPPNPAPSARIEEVPSPGRNFNPQPSTFYQGQANYSGGYQEQPRGYDQMSQQSFQLYEQSRSSQNVHAGSSTQGGQAHSYMAPTQPHMFALPRSTPPFIPPSDSRPHQSARATLQPNSRPPTYQQTSQSNSGQRPSPAPSYPQPTTQTHPSHTMAAKPPQSQSQSNPFETPASRTSQPRESPFAAPAQPPRTTPQPPNPQRQSSTPQGQRPQAVEQPLAVAPRTTIVPQPQNSQRQSSTPQVQRPQANQQPLTVAPSVTITPQSQRQPSAPQVPQPQNRPPATLAHSTQPTQSTSRPAQSQPPAPTPTASGSRPVDSQQSQASQKVATDAAHKPSDPAPSYGMSPFAHNPVPKTQPNPTPAPPAQQPVASSATSAAPSHTAIVPANTQPLATTSQDLGHFPRFLSLIDMWQRASPPLSYLDIPHANVRVKKSPSGEIRFFCPDLQTHEQVWISPEAAFQRLRFQGAARIFVNPRGLNELLQVPLPKALENSYKSYTGITVTNAPVATFPSPPGPSPPVPMQKPTPTPVSAGYTPAVRTPRQADKRFMAHDILRALGKTPLDDDRVQYAKRRAVEAPQVAEEPVVMARISSNEPSAKSTPSTSRTSTPAPSMPVPVPVPVSLQMQVPPWQVPMFAATPLLQSAPPQQIPLFLPASPPPIFTRRAKSPPSRSAKLTFDYVLIPPAPPHVKQDLARRRSRRTPEPMVVDEPPIEDVSMLKEGEEGGEPEPEREPEIDLMELKRRRARGMYQNTENEEEQAAMLEACTRMREVPCRWFACTSVLNSLENVVTHLHEVHAQEDMDLTTCMWDVCGESFATSTQLALHAETHVLGAIPCPYQDCDEIFPSPRELVAHNGLGHADQNSSGESVPPRPLLPSMRPSAPEEASLALPAVPQSAPTWELHLPEVGMPHISGDRHKTLGPWVARNISAPATNVRARRYNAAVQLKTSSSSAFQPNYEFVEMSSRHYSSLPSRPARVPEMADLNSKDVSDWLAKGELVLWPPEEGFEAEELMEEGSTSSTVVEQTRMLEKTLDDEAEKAAVPQWNTDEHSTSLPVENTELALTQPLWGTEKTVDGEIQLSGAADEEMAVENMLQEELDDLQNVA